MSTEFEIIAGRKLWKRATKLLTGIGLLESKQSFKAHKEPFPKSQTARSNDFRFSHLKPQQHLNHRVSYEETGADTSGLLEFVGGLDLFPAAARGFFLHRASPFDMAF
jgi:hypothetical protein